LFARVWSAASATSSSVAIAAEAQSGLALNVPAVGHALAAVPVGVAAEREQRHQRTLATEGAARQPARNDLGERRQIGRDAEVRLGAARRVAEAGDHFVEDQHHAVALRQRPQLLQIARDRRRRPRLPSRPVSNWMTTASLPRSADCTGVDLLPTRPDRAARPSPAGRRALRTGFTAAARPPWTGFAERTPSVVELLRHCVPVPV